MTTQAPSKESRAALKAHATRKAKAAAVKTDKVKPTYEACISLLKAPKGADGNAVELTPFEAKAAFDEAYAAHYGQSSSSSGGTVYLDLTAGDAPKVGAMVEAKASLPQSDGKAKAVWGTYKYAGPQGTKGKTGGGMVWHDGAVYPAKVKAIAKAKAKK